MNTPSHLRTPRPLGLLESASAAVFITGPRQPMSGETLSVTNAGGVVSVDGAEVIKPGAEMLQDSSGQEVVVLGINRVLLKR